MTLFHLLAQADSKSLLDTIQDGGVIGYVIIGLSIVALVLVIMHIMQIREKALLPAEQLEQVDSMLARGDVTSALAFCADPENDSYFTRIMTAGLTRFQKSAFGVFEIKSAIEEAGEEQTARLYRSTDALGVIGAIAPLLGLLGTVVGMVGAFETLSQSAAVKPEELAGNISLALITTVLGLIVAIPCIALFTFFRNRIDAFASEAGREIERLVLHLESLPAAGAVPQRPPLMPARPGVMPPRPAPRPVIATVPPAAGEGGAATAPR
jgi:biopolymer transport protein ExbB